MHTAAIGLGSNLPSRLGSPADNLDEALKRLGALGRVKAVSSYHRTKPVGYLDQPEFLNAAAVLETSLSPLALLHGLLEVETAMGRNRANAPPKGPRIIDLDLLLYDTATLEGPELTLPHPAMHERRFVLEPLAEISPEWRVPPQGRSVKELLLALG